MNRKILILNWDSFGNQHMKKAFVAEGFDICEMDFPQSSEDTRGSEELAVRIVNNIQKNEADAVFSFNYFPVAAVAAAACKVKYISWTYDSPFVQLYSKTIEYPTNYAFVFDQSECFNLMNKGVSNVYYLPMAADTDYYDSIAVSEKEKQIYTSDIAMVGSMYTEKRHNLIRHFDGLDDYTKGYLESVMDAQKLIYGTSIIEKSITPDIVKNIQKVCPVSGSGDGLESTEWMIANYFVARKITAIERREMLEKLSEKYDVALYTPEETKFLSRVRNMGTVEYYKDSAKVFKCAKINLNISLRSIVTGIPLRAIDIMGNGGFLLTNYQADFEGLFESGKDYAYFESQDDLVEKAGYYLSHEDERKQIAYNGYMKIKEYHTFLHRVRQIKDIVWGE